MTPDQEEIVHTQ